MVLTVTLNPAIDKIVLLNGYHLHALHRIGEGESSSALPGGKGVNIAIGLKVLGDDVITTGFASGYTGHLLTQSLRDKGISTSFLFTDGTTRTNISILDIKNETLTEVNEMGSEIAEEDQVFFLESYKHLLKKVTHVVIAGSLPVGVPDSFYAELIRLANDAKVQTLLHVSPDYFEAVLAEKPDILIPDLRSEKELYGRSLSSVEDLMETGVFIMEKCKSLRYVVFENRIENVVAISRNQKYIVRPEGLKIVNMLGYADAYISGFVHGLIKGDKTDAILKYASACGLANVESLLKDLKNPDEIEKNIERIKLERCL